MTTIKQLEKRFMDTTKLFLQRHMLTNDHFRELEQKIINEKRLQLEINESDHKRLIALRQRIDELEQQNKNRGFEIEVNIN